MSRNYLQHPAHLRYNARYKDEKNTKNVYNNKVISEISRYLKILFPYTY